MVLEKILDFIKNWGYAGYKNKILRMTFPPSEHTIIKINGMYHDLHSFFQSPSPGVSLYWAPRGSGKTTTLSHLRPEGVIYWDCKMYPDFERIFFARLGMDLELEKECLLRVLHLLKYTTLVLDHFDSVTNTRFLGYMGRYLKILLVCDSHKTASDILYSLRPRATLIGDGKEEEMFAEHTGDFASTREAFDYAQRKLQWQEGNKALLGYRNLILPVIGEEKE